MWRVRSVRSRCWRSIGVEGGFCLLEALEMPEVTRCELLCMLEAAEGRLCLLEVRIRFAKGISREGRI